MKTPQEKQDIAIGQFSKDILSEERRTEPNTLETLIQRSKERIDAYASKKAKYENTVRMSPKFIHTGK